MSAFLWMEERDLVERFSGDATKTFATFDHRGTGRTASVANTSATAPQSCAASEIQTNLRYAPPT